MKNGKTKTTTILLLKIVAIEECLTYIFSHYFFEINPFDHSAIFFLFLFVLILLNWHSKKNQIKNHINPIHFLLTIIPLFLAIHFRAGIVWALNTFPLRDANTVLLTLQEPFDEFAYLMVRQYLKTTIPQALIISIILIIFLYTIFSSIKKRFVAIGAYFLATIALLISDIPVSDYFHILTNEPEKNTSYSAFFVKNYVNPDSVKITAPEQKRNLILIYLESLETTFSDKEHGGSQDSNLIPEITDLAQQNISFGKNQKYIGGGFDTHGSSATFFAMHSRSLGIPSIINYNKTPILHHYKSLYQILDESGYKQIFFQGNSGLFKEFRDFVKEQKVNEVYGPTDLIQKLNLDTIDMVKRHGGKTVQDKDAFKFAVQILDTLPEPFSLTFFTIDTHAPYGIYDPDCVKSSDENNKEEQLKAAARCVSRELNNFLTSLKSKPFYENTTIVIFGDHLFMGTSLVKGFNDRKWVNVFINSRKTPTREEKRLFSDIDMFPTILSAINFSIENNQLGLGTDLFSDKKTLIETIGLDSLNKEIDKLPSHLTYESYMLQKKLK